MFFGQSVLWLLAVKRQSCGLEIIRSFAVIKSFIIVTAHQHAVFLITVHSSDFAIELKHADSCICIAVFHLVIARITIGCRWVDSSAINSLRWRNIMGGTESTVTRPGDPA